MNRRQFLLSLVALGLTSCRSNSTKTAIPKGATVVALGDSLTFGYGSSANHDYPSLLAKKTGWQVINAGVNGDTSADVLARLDDVIAKNPDLVLLGVGGNDVLKRIAPKTTQDNLLKIISKLQNNGIDVIIIAQPHVSLGALLGKAQDNPIYKTVADETDTPLLSKTWSKVLSDVSLKSDKIHANDQGYACFTDELYAFLLQLGYI